MRLVCFIDITVVPGLVVGARPLYDREVGKAGLLMISCAIAAACGRSHFDTIGGPGDRDAQGSGSAVDANLGPPNRVFVTRSNIIGTFGARANADALCATSATNAGLTGTFVAWISTTSLDAIDLLSGSRGWVRTDGAPVTDTPQSLLGGVMFNPIAIDEAGLPLANAEAWTGTLPNGRRDTSTGNCGDWSNGAASSEPGNTGAAMPDFTFSVIGILCSGGSGAHLYCFEIGKNVGVAPRPSAVAGRLAFLSTPRTTESSIGALDAKCASDAAAAGLPGTYLAAVATTTTTIASRFTLDSRPWQRVDGTQIAAGGAIFAGPVTSFINQGADGAYRGGNGQIYPTDAIAWTGATDPVSVGTMQSTCNDWADHTSTTQGLLGKGDMTDVVRVWYGGAATCSSAQPVFCLQQ